MSKRKRKRRCVLVINTPKKHGLGFTQRRCKNRYRGDDNLCWVHRREFDKPPGPNIYLY